jgi:hypothetical protein
MTLSSTPTGTVFLLPSLAKRYGSITASITAIGYRGTAGFPWH